MRIRFGYDLSYDLTSRLPIVLMLHLRPELVSRLGSPENLIIAPDVDREEFFDGFGNRCIRIVAPPGTLDLRCDAWIKDSGRPSPIVSDAREHPVSELPPEVLSFLLPSRYCDLELLGPLAWSLFGDRRPGWARVQGICDWVHANVHFDYLQARSTRTAHETFKEGTGVCRDFTHLAMALCRCMNIPARYVTGYLGDIGVPRDPAAMDFSAWMEVYLGGQWHVFDVRHNVRRIGHLAMAWGRDAADVAFVTSFGPHAMVRFVVKTEEMKSMEPARTRSDKPAPLYGALPARFPI